MEERERKEKKRKKERKKEMVHTIKNLFVLDFIKKWNDDFTSR
jgi:hypothetical protein